MLFVTIPLFYSAGQVGLLQSAAFAQGEAGLKSIPVTGTLSGEENSEATNLLTITGEDGLVYQVREYLVKYSGSPDNSWDKFLNRSNHLRI